METLSLYRNIIEMLSQTLQGGQGFVQQLFTGGGREVGEEVEQRV